jgi:hypothetical protein
MDNFNTKSPIKRQYKKAPKKNRDKRCSICYSNYTEYGYAIHINGKSHKKKANDKLWNDIFLKG